MNQCHFLASAEKREFSDPFNTTDTVVPDHGKSGLTHLFRYSFLDLRR